MPEHSRFKILFCLYLFFLLCLPLSALAGQSDTLTIKVKININQSPVIQTLVPPNESRFTEGNLISVSVTATDADGDTLQYRFLVDGVVKQDWSAANTYSWQTQSADCGLHQVKAEVKDMKSGQDSRQIELYIYHKPIGPPE